MRRLSVLVLPLVIGFLALPAAAAKVSVGSLRGQVHVEQVTTLVSRTDESKEDFLRRLGGLLAAYTEHTGFEACGSIYQGQGRYGVVVTSSLAHAYCGSTDLSPGMSMVPTNESIHSHPQVRTYIVNANDEVFSNFRHRKRTRISVDSSRFSDADYASGPGYLVTEGQLLYQAGEGRERVVGPIQDADPEVVQSIVASL